MKKYLIILTVIFISKLVYSQDIINIYQFPVNVVIISVTEPWISTGISISEGDTIMILTNGIATTNKNYDNLWIGPEGIGVVDSNQPVPDASSWSVIAKIGLSGKPFFIGRHKIFHTNISGELYLGYNDYYFADNFGYYIAYVFSKSFLRSSTSAMLNNEEKITLNDITLSKNYPNPFNPRTTINFSITKVSQVQINVFNSKGQNIKILINEPKNPGNYSVIWDGTDFYNNQLSSGQYYYQLKVNGLVKSEKMILLK